MVDEVVYRCGVCHKEFADMDQCKRHLSSHNNIATENGTIVTDTEVWRCPYCDLDLKTPEDCQFHIIEQHSETAMLREENSDQTTTVMDFSLIQVEGEEQSSVACVAIQDATSLPLWNSTERDDPVKSAESESYRLVDIVLDRGEEAIFGCENCGEIYQDEADILAHIKKSHENEPTGYVRLSGLEFVCDICDLALNSEDELKSHKSTVHSDQRTCISCNAKFSCHSDREKCESCNTAETETEKDCEKAKEVVQPSEVVISISKSLDDIIIVPCPDCDRTFTSKRALNSHWAVAHKTLKDIYKCECGKRFRMAHLLRKHRRVHSGEKPFSCDECKATFADRSALILHTSIHTGLKRYVCPHQDCMKEFAQSSNLRIHMRRHSGEKPYQCPYCDQRFMYRSQLVRHTISHTGVMPYSCDECGKGFAQKGNLNVHKRIHNGKKPYVCDLCEATFMYKTALVTHSEMHTGEKPYKCHCGKGFCQRSGLNAHARAAHKDKPQTLPICRDCNLGFSSNEAYATHMKFKHSVKINITTLNSSTA